MKNAFEITILAVLLSLLKINGQRERRLPTNLTIDQIMLNIYGSNEDVGKLIQLPDPNLRMAELDMVLTQEQYEAFYPSQNKRKKRKAVAGDVFRWPRGVMMYKIKEEGFSFSDIYFIKVAMREWEKYTCVRFEEASPSTVDYVLIQDGFGCNSQLGKVGGDQRLNLDRTGCRWKGLYLHEIGHALGLIHEHQRPIRDNFIRIIENNVDPAMLQWFQKYPRNAVDRFDVNYEYSSVMHYGITAFSKLDANRKPLQTIKALQPGREEEIGRVYLKELSFTDIEIVNRMYDCNAHCDLERIKCINGGFVDQNCNCLCPDGSSDCREGETPEPSCRNSGNSWSCYIWATQGECERNPGYMRKNCEKACGLCGKTYPAEGCSDVYSRETCEGWKKIDDCIVNEPFMRKVCSDTCGFCSRTTLPGTSCDNTYTEDEKCENWAKQGECQINVEWMPQNCQKACHTCPETGDEDRRTIPTQRPTITTRRPGVTSRRPRVTTGRPRLTTRKTVTTLRPPSRTTARPTPTTTVRPFGNCRDRDSLCKAWARAGHCKINPGWMLNNCMLSCDTCRPETTTPKIVSTTSKPIIRDDSNTGSDNKDQDVPIDDERSTCKNIYTKDNLCDAWAANQHCVINPEWMIQNCKKSCEKCPRELIRTVRSNTIQAVSGNSSASALSGSVVVLLFTVLLTKVKV